MTKKTDSHDHEVQRLVSGQHHDPHSVLGIHPVAGGFVIRAFVPEASSIELQETSNGSLKVPLERVHDEGLFEARLDEQPSDYRFVVSSGDNRWELSDPYRFSPTLGDLDLHLIGEGRHKSLWTVMGAHVREHEGVRGTSFAVWAPNARTVRVVGDFNLWDGRVNPMRSLGVAGLWEIFLPGVEAGTKYKYEIISAQGALKLKADPFGFQMEVPPGTASVVNDSSYRWKDDRWISRRAKTDPLNQPISIYECHLESWKRGANGERLNYREIAHLLAEYLTDLGFTHVEFMPVAEHPFGGSWGYQVSGYFAPTSRFGTPDDFRYLVDHLHERGVGVIVDWVPAHFPKDDFSLALFDGTALFEHADPRKGEHPDWGTLVFNFGRTEVRNFLLANARYWIEEFHIDGLRVDAVASMLYLDYSRKAGEWVPNAFGGRENLEAVEFLKELNIEVHSDYPGVLTLAEESTAWQGVSRPTYVGGLGFGFKWNMGWMHDTLEYFSKEPIYRRFHHDRLTFGLLYAFHENFVLPLSHDEVVHGKGSLLRKMPGDRWQQMANLRSLYAWMWAHPGKQLLFMGGEIAQETEWSHDSTLQWEALEWDQHRGVQDLVRSLNFLYTDTPSLWERDFTPDGFRWIDASDPDQNVLSFIRYPADGPKKLVCIANLAPMVRSGYRLGLPSAGEWKVALNTDEVRFGGSGSGPQGSLFTEDESWHGWPQSAVLDLPPLGVLWLTTETS
ncbi:MAG: 1,4-alpha-glucan branching protein GlgB [Actinobacteria bacterium]|nr:1,4-alpha-glucan branching protein GlgB [Actinomycetota bacterium]